MSDVSLASPWSAVSLTAPLGEIRLSPEQEKSLGTHEIMECCSGGKDNCTRSGTPLDVNTICIRGAQGE